MCIRDSFKSWYGAHHDAGTLAYVQVSGVPKEGCPGSPWFAQRYILSISATGLLGHLIRSVTRYNLLLANNRCSCTPHKCIVPPSPCAIGLYGVRCFPPGSREWNLSPLQLSSGESTNTVLNHRCP